MLGKYARLYTAKQPPNLSSPSFPSSIFYHGVQRIIQSTPRSIISLQMDHPSQTFSSRIKTRSDRFINPFLSVVIHPIEILCNSRLCGMVRRCITEKTMLICRGKEIIPGHIVEFTHGLKSVSKGFVEVHT